MFFAWYWVKTTLMPRVAFANALNTERESFEKSVCLHGIISILRTSGVKTAIRAQQRADE